MKALETRYAGCRFRSRLEARWAVFFDSLGISWIYEPQGYRVGPGERRRPYLPDFYLPEEYLWVEVKGDHGQIDHQLLVDAAIPHWGLPDALDSARLLVLGPVPRPGGRVGHSVLAFHKGDVHRHWLTFEMGRAVADWNGGTLVGSDAGDAHPPQPPLTACGYFYGEADPIVRRAYEAARSARFEHGESGAR